MHLRRLTWSLLALCLADPAAATWAPNGVPVCTAPGNRSAPLAIADGTGGALFVWEDYRAGHYECYAQRLDAGGNRRWPSEGVRVASTPNAWGPRAASDQAGGVYVSWYDTREPGSGIYLQRLTGVGTVAAGWPETGLFFAASSNLMPAVLASDGDAGVFAAWNPGGGELRLQRVTSEGVLAPGWPAGGRVLAAGRAIGSSLAAYPGGRAVLGWSEFDGTASRAGSIVVEGNGDVLFETAACPHEYAAQSPPDPRADAAGGVFDVWFDGTPGSLGYFVRRSTAADQSACRLLAVAIQGGGFPNPAPPSPGPRPVAVEDGGGGMYFAWEDFRTGDHITALRLTSAAGESPGWPAGGLALATGPHDKGPPNIAAIDGGIVVVWADARAGSWDVYAQRVLAGGAIPDDAVPGGEPVAALPSWQESPAVVADGTGGAIVSWLDGRDGGNHIYAQHLAPGTLDVPGGERGLDLRAWPNPASRSLAISFVMFANEAGVLELFDATGRRVVRRELGNLALGRHTILLEEATSLATGLYVMRLEHGGRRAERKIAIVR